MAGLLAGAILRNQCKLVLEAQPNLPNNHSAVLRFRSSIVGDTIGVPFKKVTAVKAVAGWMNPVADMLAYSRKTNGTYTLRSIATASGEVVERYIAPPDLVARMRCAVMAPVRYGHAFHRNLDGPSISTMPMPALMDILEWEEERPNFEWVAGININVQIAKLDAYFSLYVPDPAVPFSRISATGPMMTIEFLFPWADPAGVADLLEENKSYYKELIPSALHLLGIGDNDILFDPEIRVAKYAKILPVPDHYRKRFMLWATEKHNVYSLGRFATWRPGLLLDDLVNDIRVIQKMVATNSTYDQRR